jgi:hypothetical protein
VCHNPLPRPSPSSTSRQYTQNAGPASTISYVAFL